MVQVCDARVWEAETGQIASCKFGAKWGDPISNKQLKNRCKAEEMGVLFGKVPAV